MSTYACVTLRFLYTLRAVHSNMSQRPPLHTNVSMYATLRFLYKLRANKHALIFFSYSLTHAHIHTHTYIHTHTHIHTHTQRQHPREEFSEQNRGMPVCECVCVCVCMGCRNAICLHACAGLVPQHWRDRVLQVSLDAEPVYVYG
jgi:hypothetical protein